MVQRRHVNRVVRRPRISRGLDNCWIFCDHEVRDGGDVEYGRQGGGGPLNVSAGALIILFWNLTGEQLSVPQTGFPTPPAAQLSFEFDVLSPAALKVQSETNITEQGICITFALGCLCYGKRGAAIVCMVPSPCPCPPAS